jgi:nucleoside-diphosphate-sugar epimerase/uncharacterized membrane protein
MDNREIVIITGSSGYIGSALAKKLAKDYQVIGLDRGHPRAPVPDVSYHSLDFSSASDISATLEELGQKFGKKIKSVIHLVAYYSFSGEESDLYEKITVNGTRALLRGLNDLFSVGQFIFSSTMLVHERGNEEQEITEDSRVKPSWPYPKSKIDAEKVIEEERRAIKVVNLRIAGVYDDFGHSVPIGNHIMRIFEQHFSSLLFPGNYDHRQSYLHLEDLTEAIQILIKRSDSFPDTLTLLLGEDEAMSFKELQNAIGELVHGKAWPIIRVPRFLARSGAFLLQKLPLVREPFIKPWMIAYADDHYDLDIQKARQVLAWEPKHKLRQSLPKMIEALKDDPERWYKEHKMSQPFYRELDSSPVGELSHRFSVLFTIFLGMLVFSNPFMVDNLTRGEFWNEIIVGPLVILIATVSLLPTLRWVRWLNTFLATWLMFSPLFFWSKEAAVYSNNTILSALILLASAYTPSADVTRPSSIPPGWSYNPSTWGQRLPIMFLAFMGFLLAKYLAAFQLGHISEIPDPFFGDGTEKILTSDVSKAFPVSDAGLGALSYLLDVIAASIGDKNRWRTMPWMVIIFGFLIIPSGVTSIVLIMLQPIGVGAWCTICLITAVILLVMVPPSLDEVFASVQYLRRSVKQGKPFWRTFFFGGEAETEKPVLPDEEYAFPWHLLASSVLGTWMLFAPYYFKTTGAAASNIYISSALVITFGVVALSKVARLTRLFNVALGVWIAASAFFLGEMSTAAIANSLIVGILLTLLSLPRGRIGDHFGTLDPWVRWGIRK